MHRTVRFLFQPTWTARIHAEWRENVLANRPDLDREKLERTRDRMNRWGRDGTVPEHAAILETFTLPDPGDRHVLAAAMAAKAPRIISFIRSDFPASALAPYGIRAVHPVYKPTGIPE